jgi:hypothetical protein
MATLALPLPSATSHLRYRVRQMTHFGGGEPFSAKSSYGSGITFRARLICGCLVRTVSSLHILAAFVFVQFRFYEVKTILIANAWHWS